MTSGAFVPSLSCYLLVEISEPKVKGISFSNERPAETSKLAEEISAYLEEGAPCPEVELDWSRCTKFQKEIYARVRSIPRGTTMTYGQVAALAGHPGAARAVGRAMATNPFAILVPCHRVVAGNGLGGYLWGREMKEKLLGLERGESILRSSPAFPEVGSSSSARRSGRGDGGIRCRWPSPALLTRRRASPPRA
jgi:methylated-DNA-[protein]-cysteine S-methyltransferase